MRIIAGQFRSRSFTSLPGLDVRPTSDRLRETLFDVLTAGNPSALENSVWTDLFAGTGAVGIEALSRGAAMVYFVEKWKRAAGLIRQNLEPLNLGERFEVLQEDSKIALEKLTNRGIKPDFVFLDPPYRMQQAYRDTLIFLSRSSLSAKALIVAEHEKRFDPGEEFGTLHRFRKLTQGDTALSFYHSG
jgi:16S rRNA (guanine966-N2)-methyltransferase